jgi:hypothetical protein
MVKRLQKTLLAVAALAVVIAVGIAAYTPSNVINIMDQGATCDGVHDDQPNIQRAVNLAGAGGSVVFPPSATACMVGSTITLSNAGVRIKGAGLRLSTIEASGANYPIITVNALNTTTEDLHLSRAVTATSGGDGIYQQILNDYEPRYLNLLIEGQWNGMNMGSTAFGRIQNVDLYQNYSNGWLGTGVYPGHNGLQWNITDTVSEQNNGYGFYFNCTVACTAGAPISNITTFANSLGGVRFSGGTFYAIQGTNWYLGSDNIVDLYLDLGNGTENRITGLTTEETGRFTTGVGFATPAGNSGYGVYITNTSPVSPITISNFHFRDATYSGLFNAGSYLVLTNGVAVNNGRAAGGTFLQAGIATAGPLKGTNITSLDSATLGGAGTQLYGFYTSVDTINITASDFCNNATTGLLSTVALANSTVQASCAVNTFGGNFGQGKAGATPTAIGSSACQTYVLQGTGSACTLWLQCGAGTPVALAANIGSSC